MANIQNVDYNALPNIASRIRLQGKVLNDNLTKAYAVANEMKNNWYGNRYNLLAQSFTSLVPELNAFLELVVGDIPFALETVANNYSQVDRGENAVSATRTQPNSIADVEPSTQTTFKFVTAEVENAKTQIETAFNNAIDVMGVIEKVYGEAQWESEAASAFRNKFSSSKTHITNEFGNIQTLFSNLMTEAISAVEEAESANTVQE